MHKLDKNILSDWTVTRKKNEHQSVHNQHSLIFLFYYSYVSGGPYLSFARFYLNPFLFYLSTVAVCTSLSPYFISAPFLILLILVARTFLSLDFISAPVLILLTVVVRTFLSTYFYNIRSLCKSICFSFYLIEFSRTKFNMRIYNLSCPMVSPPIYFIILLCSISKLSISYWCSIPLFLLYYK